MAEPHRPMRAHVEVSADLNVVFAVLRSILYIFSFDKEGFNQEDFDGWPNTDVIPIPQGLLEDLENFNVG